MNHHAVKGLLIAVVALLALNLVGRWAMSEPAKGSRPHRIVTGMALREVTDRYLGVYRIYEDGAIEFMVILDPEVPLEHGKWLPLETLTPRERLRQSGKTE
jgi:hypothetical protein